MNTIRVVPKHPTDRIRRLRAIFANLRDRMATSPGGGRLKAVVIARRRGRLETAHAKNPQNARITKRVKHIRDVQMRLLNRRLRTQRKRPPRGE